MPSSSDFNELSTPFTIEERSGDKRHVVLTGRALPYRPLSLSGTQRNTVEWYTGNPIGVLQVYGAKEEPTTINGQWKDVFLGAAAYATVDGDTISTVTELSDVIDDIRVKGQEVKVTWLDRVRFGVLSRFTQKWFTGHDLEWEIEFTWIAKDDVTLQTIPFTSSTAASDIADTPNQIDAVTSQLTPAQAGFSTAFDSAAQGPVDDIDEQTLIVLDLVDELFDAVAQVAQYATTTPDAQRRVSGVLDGIKLEASGERDLWQDEADGARLNIGGTFGDVLADRASIRQQAAVSDQAAVLAAAQQKQILATIQSQVLAVFQARQGDDLRRVSTLYYGTPDGWQGLMLYNELRDDVLDAGQTVVVPVSLTTGVQP
jgi:hypothetical protein